MRPAARAGAGNDISPAVAVHVPGRHPDAAGERGVVSEEAVQHGSVLTAEDLDVRAAAGVGADDDVAETVAVDISSGDVDAAGKARIKSEEARQEGAVLAVEDLDVRPAAGARRGDNVRDVVAV